MLGKAGVVLIVDLDENSSNILRCWSIAEALRKSREQTAILFSSSTGVHVPIRAGYQCEYFPCYSSNGFDYALWNEWLETRILELCAAYRVDSIVYVGDRPPAGLLSAFDGLFHASSVWVSAEAAVPGLPRNSLAIHFDLVFEESATPVRQGAQVRRTGIFLPLAPLFRRGPNIRPLAGRRARGFGGRQKQALLLMRLRHSPSSRSTYEFAQALQRADPDLRLRIQISDPQSQLFLDDSDPETEKFLQTAETVRDFDFVIFESCDAAALSTVLSARVPAILMRGDPLQRDRVAEFAAREKIALVQDAAELPPKRVSALFRRIDAVRARLARVKLANGTETLCKELDLLRNPG